eukprot:TRINITY_DN3709_c0_g1_i3.p1 TRINITY_DN3709_c0_g1~~TRINITY_DN3709_c0_g1_i3.p1  ORF type:complete len:405 (-),score=51.83 TRINITY_DN3709_c0_g1_i3:498-1712(-)
MDNSPDLIACVSDVLQKLHSSEWRNLDVTYAITRQQRTLFSSLSQEEKDDLLLSAKNEVKSGNEQLSRAIGSMLGMAVADSLGHAFEFLPVQEEPFTIDSPRVDHDVGKFRIMLHKYFTDSDKIGVFRLNQGQWTDDTSMGLCLADSLLVCDQYDGANVRIWFWNWLENGVNNAFSRDEDRLRKRPNCSATVGLGGNICKSLEAIRVGEVPPSVFESNAEDAGNGSLMRLAPIPIFFHRDIQLSTEMARQSSFSTHPGHLAAEACAFLAYAITSALVRKEPESPQTFLERLCTEYEQELAKHSTPIAQTLLRLLRSNEKETSQELCWNWKSPKLEIRKTLHNRGKFYNGYPVLPTYFGSFSMDGLAVALHSFYKAVVSTQSTGSVETYHVKPQITTHPWIIRPI